MKAYLAGPMSGLPQFNFPAFDAATKRLRELGWEIISPAEIDDEEDAGVARSSKDGDPKSANRTWGSFLARDVRIIADEGVQAIVFLPGWTDSRGARLEATVGMLQKGFLFYNWQADEGAVSAFSREAVADALYRKFQAEARA